MSREYVRCIDAGPGWVHVDSPAGGAVMYLHVGARYLAVEAVVKQHPHLFEPLEPVTPKAGGA